MISQIKFNKDVSFTNNAQQAVALEKPVEQQVALNPAPVVSDGFEKQEAAKEKMGFVEKCGEVKKSAFDVIKKFNSVSGVTAGTARGIVEGAALTGGVAVVGKALSEARSEKGLKVLGKIVGSIFSDCWKGIKGIGVWCKNVVVDATPLYKQIGSAFSAPKRFYTNYLKGHKAVGVAATVAGLGLLAGRIIQGKLQANERNADIDHKTNRGHV